MKLAGVAKNFLASLARYGNCAEWSFHNEEGSGSGRNRIRPDPKSLDPVWIRIRPDLKFLDLVHPCAVALSHLIFKTLGTAYVSATPN